MQVDGEAAEHACVEELRSMLGGGLYTICELLLARREPDGSDRVFTVRVLRHRFHEFDKLVLPVKDGVTSPRQHEHMEKIQTFRAHHAAPLRSAPPPMAAAARGTTEGDDVLDAECICITEGHADMLHSCIWSKADGGGRWLMSASADQTLSVERCQRQLLSDT